VVLETKRESDINDPAKAERLSASREVTVTLGLTDYVVLETKRESVRRPSKAVGLSASREETVTLGRKF
jgi:hypothetical protein